VAYRLQPDNSAMTDTLYFEDFNVGRTFECGPYAVAREEIVEFAQAFDPQPHHLDEDAAKKSLLGGLAASGWHVCAMTMKMFADHMIPRMAARGGSGSREARWIKPVRPGDVLRVEATVIETKYSRRRPDIGHVTFECRVFNQRELAAIVYMTPVIATRGGT
jgi:acyl dehydratase